MKSFRSFSLVSLTVFCLALLGGILYSTPAKAELQSSSQPNILQNVLEKKLLRVGVSLFTPWTIQHSNGRLVGYEIDVAKQLARDLGVKPEFHVLEWEKIIPALLNREIDIIAAGIVITPQRALKVNFSQPYDSSGINLITNISLTKSFQGPSDLNTPDVIIASVTGTVSEDVAKRVFPKATFKTFSASQDAVQAVIHGKVHGYVEHEPITTFAVLDNPGKVDEPLAKPLLETKAGFAIHKGDPDFINFLNAWITAHEADTWLASVHQYWFEGVEWRKDIQQTP